MSKEPDMFRWPLVLIETPGNTYHFINNNYNSLLLFQCLKYRTEHQQDIKKLEKLNSVLMRHAVAK